MNCPECQEEMQQGVVWLGVMSTAAKVLFSPFQRVSWIRRRLAGTIFYSGPKEGEVEILSRDWTERVGDRRGFYCRNCEIVVCHVGAQEQVAKPDLAIRQSCDRGSHIEKNQSP